jgi:hypothetical protein
MGTFPFPVLLIAYPFLSFFGDDEYNFFDNNRKILINSKKLFENIQWSASKIGHPSV